mmetsp:Transcript_11792/g.54868  ORF Transcript_11792/g.54868 Transcript_11792/m.54868 type:complete len:345 (-) Transcript_11792:81-1115(-)
MLVRFGLHTGRRLDLRLLFADVVPVGAQHRPGALLERLVHRPPRLLVGVFINLLKHRVQRRVALELILLLLLELLLQLIPVRDGLLLRRLGDRVRRPRGRCRRGLRDRRRRARSSARSGDDVPPLRRLSLLQPHLHLGRPDGRLAILREHLTEQVQVQNVRIIGRPVVVNGDGDSVRLDDDGRVCGIYLFGQHLQGDVRQGLVPLVFVPGRLYWCFERGRCLGLRGLGRGLRGILRLVPGEEIVALCDPGFVLGPHALQLRALLEAHLRGRRLAELEERHAFPHVRLGVAIVQLDRLGGVSQRVGGSSQLQVDRASMDPAGHVLGVSLDHDVVQIERFGVILVD